MIILHDVEALSMAEVAGCLNITVPTAKARAHRARLLLLQRRQRKNRQHKDVETFAMFG